MSDGDFYGSVDDHCGADQCRIELVGSDGAVGAEANPFRPARLSTRR